MLLFRPVLFSRLFRCRRGATALEFGLISGILFFIIMGIVEFGIIMFIQQVLEGATTTGSRAGITGQGGAMRETAIRQRIIQQTGGFLNPARLSVEVLSYDSFSNVGKPEPCVSPPVSPCFGQPGVNFIDINGNGMWDADMGRATAGGGGAVAVYRTTYRWQILTPFFWPLLGDRRGTFPISAVSTVRNEDF